MKLLCQKCGRAEATVHRESVVFDQKIEEHLCELCAGKGTEALAAADATLARRQLRNAGVRSLNNHRVSSFLKSAAFPRLMESLYSDEERKKVFVEVSDRGFRIHGDGVLLKRLFEALRSV